MTHRVRSDKNMVDAVEEGRRDGMYYGQRRNAQCRANGCQRRALRGAGVQVVTGVVPSQGMTAVPRRLLNLLWRESVGNRWVGWAAGLPEVG